MAKSRAALDPGKLSTLAPHRGAPEAALRARRSSRAETSKAERPTRVVKEALTIRISHELMLVLYQKQTDLRSEPGARRSDTTIGGVIESLLRQALKMESL
jgi:hypothetical protein